MRKRPSFMDYLSESTKQYINVVGEISHTLQFELGPCMAKPANGDMAWFLLTDNEEGLNNMYVLVMTPHGMFGEYNFDEVRHLSAVTNAGLLLEHLQSMGYRRLTKEELTYFFND